MTKADMRNLVLRYLKKISEGRSVAEAYDASVVDNAIDRCQAFLEAEGIAYWETSDIPDGVANAYRAYVASQCALEFLSPEQAAPYLAGEVAALRDLRRFTVKQDGATDAVYY